MVGSETYKVGIYLRLSREDEKKEAHKSESGSISNQRDIILKYIREQNLIFIDEYVDDGVSGTEFANREGWERLIADIENERINMVVTKDLSRFGRNEWQQLKYIDYFEEKGIRYVALLDNIDTADEYNTSNEMMPINMFFNEKHVRDTSKKMKASVNMKRSEGKFLGTYAPYGYNKDPQNKHKLIIDEKAAKVVKRIFALFVIGMGICEIGRILTSEKIPIPSVYKKYNRGNKSSVYGVWGTRTISDIIQLPTYTGDLTQGRTKKPSYKSKRRTRNKKENWIICPNSCPAIIDRETFELAQNIYARNKNQTKNTQTILLKGMVYCKECNHTIGFRQHKATTKKNGDIIRIYGNCNYWAKHKRLKPCTPHSTRYNELEDLVLTEIRKMCKKYLEANDMANALKNNDRTTKLLRELEGKRRELEIETELSAKRIDTIYKDRLNGDIDLEMYKRLSNEITESTLSRKSEIREIETKIYNIKNSIADNSKRYDGIIREYLSMKRPSVQLLTNIIDRIVIDEEQNVDIYYKIKPLANGY